MKKLGFTLAEVLITLVIIGVIAAMTIPTLMNNTNSQEFRSAFKKAIILMNPLSKKSIVKRKQKIRSRCRWRRRSRNLRLCIGKALKK